MRPSYLTLAFASYILISILIALLYSGHSIHNPIFQAVALEVLMIGAVAIVFFLTIYTVVTGDKKITSD